MGKNSLKSARDRSWGGRRLAALTLTSVLAGPGTAQAQMQFYDPTFWIGQQATTGLITTGNATLQNVIDTSSIGTSSNEAGQTATTLTFRSDPAVTRKVQAQLLAGVRQTNPEDAAQLEQVLASGQVRPWYEAAVRSLGLRPDDALDSLTVYLMVTWAVVNNTDLTPTPGMVRALRTQVGRAYAATAGLLDTGAKRQEFGETLIYQAALMDSLHTSLLGMPARERQRVADQVYQVSRRTLDLDLRALVLTEQGFRRRG